MSAVLTWVREWPRYMPSVLSWVHGQPRTGVSIVLRVRGLAPQRNSAYSIWTTARLMLFRIHAAGGVS